MNHLLENCLASAMVSQPKAVADAVIAAASKAE